VGRTLRGPDGEPPAHARGALLEHLVIELPFTQRTVFVAASAVAERVRAVAPAASAAAALAMLRGDAAEPPGESELEAEAFFPLLGDGTLLEQAWFLRRLYGAALPRSFHHTRCIGMLEERVLPEVAVALELAPEALVEEMRARYPKVSPGDA
jgi:hypothetical protein